MATQSLERSGLNRQSVPLLRFALLALLQLQFLSCAARVASEDESHETPRRWTYPEGSAQRLRALRNASPGVLFVGNSYTEANGLPEVYRALLQHAWPDVRTESVSPGGYRLVQHARDAQTEGTPLNKMLVAEVGEDGPFPFVVLQEQSQLGGFPDGNPDRTTSLESAYALASLAEERGGTLVLYMTWGRRDGDSSNEGYETFSSMQDYLDSGYLGMARELVRRGVDVQLAPVGGGFRIVYEDAMSSGIDPLDGASDFTALYSGDGSHPSPLGTYLAACIIAATTTGGDPNEFGVDRSLDSERLPRTQSACRRAVVDRRWSLP